MFRSVLAVGDFRWLWSGEALSQAGDQLARVALAVLVFQRTSSPALTALSYALTFVPTLVGGALLGWVADRVARRTVMVTCDLIRAVLVAAMAVPGMPLPMLYLLLIAVTLLGGPFRAAQQALLPDVLDGELYVSGLAIRGMTIQAAQLAGFACGGLLVAALTPYWALAVDAATFVASALLVGFGVRHPAAVSPPPPVTPPATPSSATPTPPATRRSATQSPAPPTSSPSPARPTASVLAGFRVVLGDRAVRALAVLSWLAGFYVVPEGLAAPYAAAIGTGTVGIGLLMAADPAGSVVGAFVLARWIPERLRTRLLGLLAVLAGLPLLVCALQPGLLVSLAALGISGALAQAYQTQDTASLARAVPSAGRAQVMGIVVSGLVTVQGIGVLVAGVLADVIGTPLTIGLAGLGGMAVGAPAALSWHRATRRSAPELPESSR
ncbi:MFS transporter [Kutzneria sp. CA-103260]|uniref:MFS transporter n=1 Tax=Kutzneria sp. CA-103260 TaxID=2802641 RepID=UPI001BA99B34|nr:MFS transporter [Kutzneria sp. CA-103260]QUQ72110.1 major facilitator superfamily transporter [Kutzneria sp. CA-103260]